MNEEINRKDATVEAAAVVAKATVNNPTLSIRPNLWHNWTRIAIRAEARASEARRLGMAAHKAGQEYASWLTDETLESMVTVAATRTALTHLEADWSQRGFLQGVRREDIPKEVTTDPPEDVTSWLAEIKRLIDDRIRIAHHPQPSTPGDLHPAYPTHVSAIDAYYTVERASAAVDLLLDFFHRVIASPSDRISGWAEKQKHVPSAFDESRNSSGG